MSFHQPACSDPGASAPAQPLWLDLPLGAVFMLLHEPSEQARRDTAVLICPPFGWEEMCSYRGRREWAQMLSQAGFPCARLDLPATGNSTGSPGDPNRFEAWVGAVKGAVLWLRGATACRRIVVVGIGLGGLIACRAAEVHAPIDDFILWGVPARGRALLRELRAYAGMVEVPETEDPRHQPVAEGELELTGFRVTAETARAIEGVQLDPSAGPVVEDRRVLILGRDGLEPDQRLVDGFREAGAEVTVAETNDYGELMGHPQLTGSPMQTIELTRDWLVGQPGSDTPVQPGFDTPVQPGAGAAVVLARPGIAPGLRRHERADGVRETVFPFTDGLEGRFAILAEPRRARPEPVCAVWVNAGTLHHIGPNRAWVEVSRRWAARGVPTLRVDLEGFGEAHGAGSRPLPDAEFYGQDRVGEVLAVLDHLADRDVATEFFLGGFCSGAYWALHAGLADPRVRALMLVNLYAFYWSEELIRERGLEQTLDRFVAKASGGRLRAESTHRSGGQIFYLSDDAAARPAVATAARRLSPRRLHSAVSRPLQRGQRADIEGAFNLLRNRGTETLLLLGRWEGLYEQLRRQGALENGWRWPNLTIETMFTRDHMLRSLWRQQRVHQSLDRALARALGVIHAI